MPLISRLERRLGRFAVPNLTVLLIAGQVLVFGLTFFAPQGNPADGGPAPDPGFLEKLDLVPDQVLAGEVWRIVTFLFVPPITNPIFAFFFWYLFYLMGTALELSWGTFRYNVYLLVGYAATVAVSFLTPEMPSTNGFLQASVFLAFAHLYPDFLISLFFLLPIKVKWLALVTWIGYLYTFAVGDWSIRLVILASVCNFLLFFGREILWRMKSGHRRMTFQAARVAGPKKRVHRCEVCGISSETEPTLDFRYCSKCAGARCYCPEHIRRHEHVASDESQQASERGV
jgi:hypothetical protein